MLSPVYCITIIHYLYKMSHSIIVSAFFFLFVSAGTMAQDTQRAIEYNNYIIKEQTKLISKGLEYMSFSVHSEDYNLVEKKRIELIDEIYASIKKIRKMPDFNGSNRLKNITIDVFHKYLEVYETDLIEVMGLKKQYRDSYTALEAYLKAEALVDIKLNNAVEKLANAQEHFAEQNNLKVEGSESSVVEDEVLEISQLSTYTRLVFLEYFEVSWKFHDMVNVLHERNGKLLNKKRELVVESAQQALLNLRGMRRFKNEKDYIGQTIDIIEYFYTLAQKDFAKVAMLFDKETLTREEADYINQVFRDYNANIEVLVYNWNLANQDLWRANVKEME